MRTLPDAARQRMRHTQKALQTDTVVLLEKLLHMLALRFSSHAVSDCRPIGRRSVYHSRRIALSSPNSSCAQENSATAHPYSSGYTLSRSSPLHLLKHPLRYRFALLGRTPERAGAEGRAKRLVKLRQIIRSERPAVLHHDHIIVIVVGILIFCPARLLILLRRLQHIAQCIRQVQRARRGRRFRAFLEFLLPACVRVFSIVMVWCSRSISLHRRPHSSPRRSPRYAQIYIGNSSRVPTALSSRTPSCSGV